jgi:hypothetical protein
MYIEITRTGQALVGTITGAWQASPVRGYPVLASFTDSDVESLKDQIQAGFGFENLKGIRRGKALLEARPGISIRDSLDYYLTDQVAYNLVGHEL